MICPCCGKPKKPANIDGLGTALKPAMELIAVARKPISEASVVKNVLHYGTGALNIDGCRVAGGERPLDFHPPKNGADAGAFRSQSRSTIGVTTLGRWPANLVHDGSPEVLAAFPETESGTGAVKRATADGYQANAYGKESRATGTPMVCHGDAGSAARFFYSAKADQDDRLGSKHPTIKPLDLMQWLVRLVTPRGGTCLDPFSGTGTTGEAAWREGMRAILIEREPEYIADIERRMELAANPTKRAAVAKTKNKLDDPNDLPLFSGEAAE